MPRVPEIPLPGTLTNGPVDLTPFGPADLDPLVAAVQDREVPRWTDVPSPYGRAEASLFLDRVEPERRAGRALALAVRSGGELCGALGLTRFSWDEGRAEVGYWLAAAARGRGLGTRAVVLLSHWALSRLPLWRLELYANPENHRSQRLAERAGYTREGLLRSLRERKGVREDLIVFARLRED